jgi:hypothetical protein
MKRAPIEGLPGYTAYRCDDNHPGFPYLLVSKGEAHYSLQRVGDGDLLKAVHYPTGRVTQISGHALLTDTGGVVRPFTSIER